VACCSWKRTCIASGSHLLGRRGPKSVQAGSQACELVHGQLGQVGLQSSQRGGAQVRGSWDAAGGGDPHACMCCGAHVCVRVHAYVWVNLFGCFVDGSRDAFMYVRVLIHVFL